MNRAILSEHPVYRNMLSVAKVSRTLKASRPRISHNRDRQVTSVSAELPLLLRSGRGGVLLLVGGLLTLVLVLVFVLPPDQHGLALPYYMLVSRCWVSIGEHRTLPHNNRVKFCRELVSIQLN